MYFSDPAQSVGSSSSLRLRDPNPTNQNLGYLYPRKHSGHFMQSFLPRLYPRMKEFAADRASTGPPALTSSGFNRSLSPKSFLFSYR